MKKAIFLLVAGLFITMPVIHAQASYGVRGGLNFSNLVNDDIDTKILTGFHLGVDVEVPVAPDFYLQPGLLFTTKGANYDISEFDASVSLNYLEVPLNLAYKPVLGDGNLILAFGPYLAYGVGGKYKIDGESESVKFGNDEDFKAFDMGANLSFGYLFQGGFLVQFNTQLGLVDIAPDGADDSVKNTGFGLSVGYRF